jgi:hypothetical protein
MITDEVCIRNACTAAADPRISKRRILGTVVIVVMVDVLCSRWRREMGS